MILYIITALYMTFGGFVTLLFISPLTGLLMITVGNIFARVMYEFSFMLVMICKNTNEINTKLGPNKYAKEVPAVPVTPVAPIVPATPYASAPYVQSVEAVPAPVATVTAVTPPDDSVTVVPDFTPLGAPVSEVQQSASADPNVCPACGTPYRGGASFCTTYGHKC